MADYANVEPHSGYTIRSKYDLMYSMYYDVWSADHMPNSLGTTDKTCRRAALNRHGNGVNCLYFDGHSEWMESYSMTEDMWWDRKKSNN